jgi:hypothetical protein
VGAILPALFGHVSTYGRHQRNISARGAGHSVLPFGARTACGP